MNAAEFNTEIGKTVMRGMAEGLHAGKMSPAEMVGILELHQGDIMRWLQDQARLAAAQHQQKGIVLPGDRRFQQPNGVA